ncbi:MAG: glycosyltransferase [Methylocystis sp.]|nr:MAG: glycosyltransferase [Methylocystis sp.]
MIDFPKLSVVIPSYQQGMFIERTIRSIVEQNYPNLELILMDGGSTDETMSIVERYKSHFAHISSGKDGGQASAIRKGFEIATGDYISWLNSDDTYNPGALLAIGSYLAEHPEVRFVYGDMDLIDAEGKLIAHKRSVKFVLGVMKYAFLTVPQMSAFWSKKLYDEVGGVDASLRFCMDYDLFVRMASRSTPVHIDRTIGNFRIHPTSKTTNLENVRQAEDRLVQTRYCDVKPSNRAAFAIVRYFYLFVLCGLMIMNGSFMNRVGRRVANNLRSECS